ncbi:EAL domain-containing protein [Vogesella sp. LIG4]|uniref:EAL domain-containing protein n=1 Tax=Vogesella sp. LIG4 TaxID=1192162 RepID=UPI00081F826E|nr:EAL domain-containing protein [Vogesella sp. LIG4]SCK26386.1 PAS domain S-box-containing protein/diguanylate cyclase (GGDEF) domain-containing protein [Vogesella sp. LIG4]
MRPAPHQPDRLLRVLWPFILVALLQAVISGISLEVLSVVRAYVSGESLWSKGQKDAIYYLKLYADSRDERDFLQYQQAIDIPLGDHQARQALDAPEPDLLRAEAGFLQGGNHPQDIPGLIWLYRNFRHFSYLETAIAHWTTGDQQLLQLMQTANQMRHGFTQHTPSAAEIAGWIAQIRRVNEQVTPVERAFSNTLGEASRFIQQLLLAANLVTTTILILLAVLRTGKLLNQRLEVESALRAEKERAQITLTSIGDAVITTDEAGFITYMNPAAEQLTTWRDEQAHGLPLSSIIRMLNEQTQQEDGNLIEQILNGEASGTSQHTQLMVRLDGSAIVVSLVASPIHSNGSVNGAVLVLHDMTRERQYVANLSWQATHDALTGLTNRREFEQRLEQALGKLSAGTPVEHALMFLDLDQFKIVNDTCGHAAGDELLRQICTLLQQQLRDIDTLARLGGDEFGILLEHCPAINAGQIAEALRQTVQELHFAWEGHPFNVSVSIGLVHLSAPMTTLAEALRAADVACYMAKEKGRNRVQVYHPDDSELSMKYGEMAWVQRIRLALEENRFCLYAQQIAPLSNDTDDGIHIELLLRLYDEYGRLVPPISFIPAAERYGLMPLIDRWVVQNAFATLVSRQQHGHSSQVTTCAINLSGSSIGDDSFLDFLHEQFRLHAIAPQRICFEITETIAIANLSDAIHFITELQKLGCRFSLDDFGAGMSSFSYLKHLPVDYLKIDGSFVKDMLDDPIDHAMVAAINHIGHVMGKHTIAEFVETPQIMQAAAMLGIDYVQGYAVMRPQPFTIDCELRHLAPQDCLLPGTLPASSHGAEPARQAAQDKQP